MEVTIFHNPRCSKSRETLKLLEARGIAPQIVLYLDDPPDAQTLRGLLQKLKLRPRDLLRRNEPAFAELGLAERLEDDEAILAAIVEAPVLMERPIVVVGAHARIGRPPERVLEILG